MGLTYDEVSRILRYEPDTGRLIWISNTGKKRMAGKAAGKLTTDGRRVIGIHGRRYKCHRIAWLLHFGEWPSLDVDHINGDPSDNRIANLRLATKTQNHANSKKYSSNKSGYKGVFWHPQNGSWVAYLRKEGKKFYLGSSADPAEAHKLYIAAAQRMFGEFATNGERSALPSGK